MLAPGRLWLAGKRWSAGRRWWSAPGLVPTRGARSAGAEVGHDEVGAITRPLHQLGVALVGAAGPGAGRVLRHPERDVSAGKLGQPDRLGHLDVPDLVEQRCDVLPAGLLQEQVVPLGDDEADPARDADLAVDLLLFESVLARAGYATRNALRNSMRMLVRHELRVPVGGVWVRAPGGQAKTSCPQI